MFLNNLFHIFSITYLLFIIVINLKLYKKNYFDLIDKNYQSRIDMIRFHSILTIINKIKPKIALDAGCGTGIYLPIIAKTAKKTYGIDFSEMGCEMARKHVKNNKNIIIKKADLSKKLPFKDSYFDFILCSEVLEHIKDYNLCLSELKRILKPNGFLLLTLPNFTFFSVEHLREAFFSKDPTHYHRYNVFKWKDILSKYFHIKETKSVTNYFSILIFYLKLKKLSIFLDGIVKELPILNIFGRDLVFILKK